MTRMYPTDYCLNAYYNSHGDHKMTLDERAETYIMGIGENVYKSFCRYAWELIFAGHKKLGAKLIAERIRWDHLTRKPDGEEFLVNNTYVAYMARKFMRENPQVGDIFETREKKHG